MHKKIVILLVFMLFLFTSILPSAMCNRQDGAQRRKECVDDFDGSASFFDDCGADGNGFGDPVRYNWIERERIVASDVSYNDEFGRAVAVNGECALIGADLNGAAYVFQQVNGSWVEMQKLVGSGVTPFDCFGITVALTDRFAFVGAHHDVNGDIESGSVFVFELIDGEWVEVQRLVPSDATGSIWWSFGRSISVDGSYLLVGADDGKTQGVCTGAAYVFELVDGRWVEMQKLIASDGESLDSFGWSVSVDDEVALIGALWGDKGDVETGAAYVFELVDGEWVEVQKLTPSDGEFGDSFGNAVVLDGNYAFIGNDGGDNAQGVYTGSVYVFKRVGGQWVEVQELTPSDGIFDNHFGSAIAFDDPYLLVGDWGGQNEDRRVECGAVYVFLRVGERWFEVFKLLPSDGEQEDMFGCYGVALEGRTALIGSMWDDVDGVSTGSVYVFERSSNVIPVVVGVSGPGSGRVGREYLFTVDAVDDDGVVVSSFFDWGDGNVSGWVNGSSASHVWMSEGSFVVRVRVRDELGAVSEWMSVSVSMPKRKGVVCWLETVWECFLSDHPLLSFLFEYVLNKV